MRTELTPFFLFQAAVSLLILKLSTGKTPRLFKFFKTTTNLHFSLVFFILTKEVFFFFLSEVNRGNYPKFVTLFARILSDVSLSAPPTLVCS